MKGRKDNTDYRKKQAQHKRPNTNMESSIQGRKDNTDDKNKHKDQHRYENVRTAPVIQLGILVKVESRASI